MEGDYTNAQVADVLLAMLLDELERVTGAPYELVLDADNVRNLLDQRGDTEVCDLQINGDIMTIKKNEKHGIFTSG